MAKSQSALLAGKFVLLEMVSAYQMIVQAESEEKRRKCLEVQFKENSKWHQEPLYPPLSDWLSSQVGKLAL